MATKTERAAPALTLETMVSRLEAQIAFHREREAFHGAQETVHREQRAVHAAELEALTTNLETLKTAAATAVKLVSRPGAALPPPESVTDFDVGRKPSLRLMVLRVVESRPAGEVFGTAAITAEVNRRYQNRLRRPMKEKVISITLRRMLDTGALRLVREGRPHHEALYARVAE